MSDELQLFLNKLELLLTRPKEGSDRETALKLIESKLRAAEAAAIERCIGAFYLGSIYKPEEVNRIRRSLSPEPNFLPRKEAEARLEEAKWWRHLAIMDPNSYFAVEGDKRIAELQRQVEALKGKEVRG